MPDNDETVKAIENPELIAAIKKHYENNTDQSADELLPQLIKAKYLAAIMNENIVINEGVMQKGSTFDLGFIKDDQNRTLLPIFTDWIHLNKSASAKSGLVMSAEWAFSMGKDDFDGVVINHTGLALPIYKKLLIHLLNLINA